MVHRFVHRKINFYLDKRKTECPIILDVRYGNTRVRISTLYTIEKEKWNSEEQIVKKNAFNGNGLSFSYINKKLTEIREDVEEKLKEVSGELTAEKLKAILQPEDKPVGFFEVFQYYINQSKSVPRRKDHITVVMNMLKSYRKKLDFDSFTPQFLGEFETHLKKGRTLNTVVSKLKILRAFSNFCVKRGYLSVSPFFAYSMPQERYGKPIILTRTERDLIVKKEIKNRKLDRVRDLFVFQCFTGCRVGDMMNLKKVNLTDGVLTYLPGKTKGERPEAVRVPLASSALEIIEKYSFKEDDFLLPVMSAQKYNDYLRELFEFLEMDRRVLDNGKLVPLYKTVSSHLARRTFIGLLHKEVKDSVIASMSGHVKGSKAFNRYFDIDDDDRRGAIDLL